ncbi:MAG: acetylxylan esterase [Williamsia sp.]|nr:acetylxylan esterase [Williamsia sp.]
MRSLLKGITGWIFFLLLPFKALVQKPFSVADWEAGRSLHAYLLEKVHKQYDERRAALNRAVGSRRSAMAYCYSMRQRLLKLLGSMPPMSPLNPVVTGSNKREGYTVKNIIYESFPHHHVTASLYLPGLPGRLPAVIFLCGHEDAAKSTESYQRTAILFAKNGFVVLVIDPISQGERLQLTSAAENALDRVGKKEHTLLNELANLAGTSAAAYQLWDNKRGLDYLTTLPEVDTARIGCIGNSGGGMQAIYFTGYEKRLKATAVCSYLSSHERMYDLEGPTDGCVELPDEGREHMEMSDYLAAAAPIPLLVLAGRFDSIDFIGTENAVDDLTRLYTALGKRDRIHLFTYDDGHGISKPKREAALAWFRKWLCKDASLVKENSFSILPGDQLQATKTGQVSTDFRDEASIASRNLLLFESLAAQRNKFLQRSREVLVQDIARLIRWEPNTAAIETERKADMVKNGITYQPLIIRRQGELPVTLLVVMPAGTPKKIVLWLGEQGKAGLADSSRLLQACLAERAALVLADIRGTGESEDKAEFNEYRYSNKEYRNAMLSLHIGSSLVTQRVGDILTLVKWMGTDERFSGLPVELNANGVLTVPALYAALFTNAFSNIRLYGGIRSYRDIFEQPRGRDWYSYFVPGMVKYYDLPDLLPLINAPHVFFDDRETARQRNYLK